MTSNVTPPARDPWAGTHIEPSIEDILSDPIIHLVLRRDGLTAGTVRTTLEHARRRLGLLPKPLRRAMLRAA